MTDCIDFLHIASIICVKKVQKNRRKKVRRNYCVENSTQNTYCVVFFLTQPKKSEFIKNQNNALKKRRKFKIASNFRRKFMRRQNDANKLRRKYFASKNRRKRYASKNRRKKITTQIFC